VPTEPACNGRAGEQPRTNPAEGRSAARAGRRWMGTSAGTPRARLRDISRADLIISAGETFFLEVNVTPGMTETSALPMALDAAGRSFGAVCRDLLGQAAARGT
jgi:D-alanine-D-alanine ligase